MRTTAIAAVLLVTALAACDEVDREKLPGVDARRRDGRTEVDANPARRTGVDAVADSVSTGPGAAETADTTSRDSPR